MSKTGNVVLSIFLVAVTLVVGGYLLIAAMWNGTFNFAFPNEIATYSSPDGTYSLVFEQMGDPGWPFGPADVRLTLKGPDGKTIERVSTQIFDDGANAGEHNVASVSWDDDAVVIVLRASEMDDKMIRIVYDKR